MKKIFIEAHKMTREIAAKYDVDYQAQFGLCVSYLLENKEEKTMLKGTEKQVKWAEDIKQSWIDRINVNIVEHQDRKGHPEYYEKALENIEKIQLAESFIKWNSQHGYIVAMGSYFGLYHPSKKRKQKNDAAKEMFESYGKEKLEKGEI